MNKQICIVISLFVLSSFGNLLPMEVKDLAISSQELSEAEGENSSNQDGVDTEENQNNANAELFSALLQIITAVKWQMLNELLGSDSKRLPKVKSLDLLLEKLLSEDDENMRKQLCMFLHIDSGVNEMIRLRVALGR